MIIDVEDLGFLRVLRGVAKESHRIQVCCFGGPGFEGLAGRRTTVE